MAYLEEDIITSWVTAEAEATMATLVLEDTAKAVHPV
jgi:hypothetical protein